MYNLKHYVIIFQGNYKIKDKKGINLKNLLECILLATVVFLTYPIWVKVLSLLLLITPIVLIFTLPHLIMLMVLEFVKSFVRRIIS